MTRTKDKLTLRKTGRSSVPSPTAGPPAFARTRAPPSGDVQNAPATQSLASITRDERHALIAEAAYYLSEQRNFEGGHEVEDWLYAESQVDAAIASGTLPIGPPPGQREMQPDA